VRFRTYQKYLLQDLFKINLLLLFIFIVVCILIDIFERLGSFLKFKKPFYLFLTYIFWKIGVHIYEIFPFVSGLAGILVLLWLSRNNELVAFLSLGFSKKELLKELGKGILLISFLAGVVLNIIFPKAAYFTLYTWDYKIKETKKQYLIFNTQIFFAGANYYLVAQPLEPKGEYLKDILIVFLKKDEPEKVIWAEEAYYINKKWDLKDVVIQKKENNFAPEIFEDLRIKLPFKPNTLVIVEKPIKFLSFPELIERFKFLKRVGRPYNEVLAEIFLKIIYLFLPFILSFFPMWIYLENYAPRKTMNPFIKGIVLFFIFLLCFLLLQTLLRKGILVAGFILVIWIVGFLCFYVYFSFLRKK
jgi:lipopolysaccharide export system permease protein